MTYYIISIPEKDEEKKDNILNCTGLELITLEQGRQFRLDLIERTECMKLLVAVTILTCQDDLERAETLNKWIQIAVETKTALGNLFGFCAIMLGLSMPQVRLIRSCPTCSYKTFLLNCRFKSWRRRGTHCAKSTPTVHLTSKLNYDLR